MEVMDADEICMVCGKLIRKVKGKYPESLRGKRRIAWNCYCPECKTRVQEEMSALGLTERLAEDYAMSRYLLDMKIPEWEGLATFVRSVDRLLKDPSKLAKETVEESRSYLRQLGLLQQAAKRILTAYRDKLQQTGLSGWAKYLGPFKMERRWQSRAKRRNERSSGRGEVVGLDVLDLLFPLLFSTDTRIDIRVSDALLV
jgi:hypothetical protein